MNQQPARHHVEAGSVYFMKTQAVKAISASVTSVLLFVAVRAWPGSGWALSSLSPLPFFLLHLFAHRYTIAVSIALAILLAALFSGSTALLFLRQLIPSFLIFSGIEKGWNSVRIISLAATLALIISALILPFAMYSDSGLHIFDTVSSSGQNRQASGKTTGIFDMLHLEVVSSLQPLLEDDSRSGIILFERTLDYLYPLLPFMIFMEQIAAALLLLACVRAVYTQFPTTFKTPEPFTFFVLPWPTVWLLIIGIASIIFLKPATPHGAAGLSVLAVSMLYFAMQGIAISEFWLQNIKTNRLLKILIYLFIMVAGIWPALLVAGVFDTWYNFRKIDRKESA